MRAAVPRLLPPVGDDSCERGRRRVAAEAVAVAAEAVADSEINNEKPTLPPEGQTPSLPSFAARSNPGLLLLSLRGTRGLVACTGVTERRTAASELTTSVTNVRASANAMTEQGPWGGREEPRSGRSFIDRDSRGAARPCLAVSVIAASLSFLDDDVERPTCDAVELRTKLSRSRQGRKTTDSH
ncbi:unnamed protein product [Lampetra planeri]